MKTFFRDYSIPTFLVFFLLYIAGSIFIPLIISIFIVILLQSTFFYLKRYLKSSFLSYVATILICVWFFSLVIFILAWEVQLFLRDVDQYKIAFKNIFAYIQTLSGDRIIFSVESLYQYFDISKIAVSLTSGLSNMFAYIATIFLFVIFMLLESPYIQIKLEKTLWNGGKFNIGKIISHISEEVSYYFLIKFLIAFSNGLISFCILSVLWVRYALFFSFVVFLLDFIPTIGWLIAMLLPFLFSFVQFSDVSYPFMVLAFLFLQQAIMWNIVEPKIMWSRLNLSTLVIIISLMFWWSLWWIVGAFLAVPIMTILNIIFSHFESTRAVSIFLSEKGKIK